MPATEVLVNGGAGGIAGDCPGSVSDGEAGGTGASGTPGVRSIIKVAS